MTQPIRVRFAPSPTGYLHIGGARTALFNWLLARKEGGVFVLRMEDTDAERNTEEARETIFRGLDWLGLTPDEGPEQGGPYGPYSQSERADIYRRHVEELITRGAVYPCFCTKDRLAELRARQEADKADLGYDRLCRGLDESEVKTRLADGVPHTWRLKAPLDGTGLVIDDQVRGRVEVAGSDIEDIILVRANGVPVYNLAVVVDDHHMRISHVLRGEDHLTNTFKQLLIYKAFGWEPPVFAHLPLILGPKGEGKLSKRKHPEAALELYQKRGYPTEALVNWLALIGWHMDGETEVMSRDELVRNFSLDQVSSGGARLPLDKLDWLSGEYIRNMSVADVADGIRPFLQAQGWHAEEPLLLALAEAFQPRIRAFGDIVDQAAWVFEDKGDIEPKALKKLKKEGAVDILEAYIPVLLDADFEDVAAMEAGARAFCEEKGVGLGALVHPLRASVTRCTAGPGLFDCLRLVGKERVIHRIREGIDRARS